MAGVKDEQTPATTASGPEVNCHGEPIDRSGARCRLNAPPTIAIVQQVPDTTAEQGLTAPTLWSEGGLLVDITVRLRVMVPVAATLNLDQLGAVLEAYFRGE